jgi:hypothetical protein
LGNPYFPFVGKIIYGIIKPWRRKTAKSIISPVGMCWSFCRFVKNGKKE